MYDTLIIQKWKMTKPLCFVCENNTSFLQHQFKLWAPNRTFQRSALYLTFPICYLQKQIALQQRLFGQYLHLASFQKQQSDTENSDLWALVLNMSDINNTDRVCTNTKKVCYLTVNTCCTHVCLGSTHKQQAWRILFSLKESLENEIETL